MADQQTSVRVEFPWLHTHPSDWIESRLKGTAASVKNGIWGSEPDGVDDFPCIRVADFDRVANRVAAQEPTMRAVTPKERDGRTLRSGDLLIEKSGGGEKQPVGCVVLYDLDLPAVCSNFVARIQVADGFDSRYLNYLHSFLYAARVNTRSIKQTTGIQNLDGQSYFNERVALPPLPTQRAIADFLDRKTRAIDELIRKKERLIALLQEKRQALITQAVTKGLDANVPMKDSGVPWLGEIPAHWEVIRNRYLFRLFGGFAFKGDYFDKSATSAPLLVTPGNFHRDGGLYFDERNATHYTGEVPFQFRLAVGDLLVVLTDLSYRKLILGRCVRVDRDDVVLNQRIAKVLMRAEIANRVHPAFLLHLLNSPALREQVTMTARGSTVFHTSPEKVGDCWAVLPPIGEQISITNYLAEKTVGLTKLTDNVVATVAVLQEYRQALISAAVTGQIDVTQEAAA